MPLVVTAFLWSAVSPGLNSFLTNRYCWTTLSWDLFRPPTPFPRHCVPCPLHLLNWGVTDSSFLAVHWTSVQPESRELLRLASFTSYLSELTVLHLLTTNVNVVFCLDNYGFNWKSQMPFLYWQTNFHFGPEIQRGLLNGFSYSYPCFKEETPPSVAKQLKTVIMSMSRLWTFEEIMRYPLLQHFVYQKYLGLKFH